MKGDGRGKANYLWHMLKYFNHLSVVLHTWVELVVDNLSILLEDAGPEELLPTKSVIKSSIIIIIIIIIILVLLLLLLLLLLWLLLIKYYCLLSISPLLVLAESTNNNSLKRLLRRYKVLQNGKMTRWFSISKLAHQGYLAWGG